MFVVAGASGKTGKVVAETLLARGGKIRVLVRDPVKGAEWRRRGAEVAMASFEDGPALAPAMEGAAGLYTLLPETLGGEDFHAHRRRMTEGLARAVTESGVPHVVFLSTIAAALPEGNGPAKDLHVAEKMLRAAAPVVTVIRASYFQENVLAALPAARYEGIYPSFLPSAQIAFPTVATCDVGRLAARCLLEPPPRSEVIDLVGPMYSIAQLATKLGSALGKDLRVVDVPPAAQLDVLMTKGGLPRQLAEAFVEMFACVGSGRVTPQGDRMVPATTTIDDMLDAIRIRRSTSSTETS
jgi:uncharacterized protein YbjT (DUF2867 family)